MIKEVFNNADDFRKQVADLKSKAPVYPKVYFEDKDGCQYVTTMVEFKYNGVIYRRHHVESIVPTETCKTNDLYNKLINAAEMCIKMAVPSQFDEIIGAANPDIAEDQKMFIKYGRKIKLTIKRQAVNSDGHPLLKN